VPVRAELSNQVAALALRAERCARRYHERAGERLAALVRVLPRRDALLGPQRQRMDEISARLDRALERRIVAARSELTHAAAVLRPALLDLRLHAAQQRLDAASRLLDAAHPERPLARGYAWVAGRPSGRVVATAEAARATTALTLHFRDGHVDVRLERPSGKSYAGDAPEQPSLL
jgi:exodeoxyribonuclease VII large subunit